jgi:hypothetical protein
VKDTLRKNKTLGECSKGLLKHGFSLQSPPRHEAATARETSMGLRPTKHAAAKIGRMEGEG